nr:MAG TPA: hypothetical protein [Caudoviricetes sp.]
MTNNGFCVKIKTDIKRRGRAAEEKEIYLWD